MGKAMTDIPAIAVEQEPDWAAPWGTLESREEPGVETNAVGGVNSGVLNRPTKLSAGRCKVAGRMVDLVVFEPAQHNP